jgi:hypothetical protein
MVWRKKNVSKGKANLPPLHSRFSETKIDNLQFDADTRRKERKAEWSNESSPATTHRCCLSGSRKTATAIYASPVVHHTYVGTSTTRLAMGTSATSPPRVRSVSGYRGQMMPRRDGPAFERSNWSSSTTNWPGHGMAMAPPINPC